jgi:pyruvate/2-oxoglutarate dehydrogenase complex dihydrolipoamide dehydrogenase (E3) component
MSGNHKFDFDLAVIGAGSGGFAAARTGAAVGLKTVVIDGARELGGLCILKGCMPTKALLHAAEVLHLARNAGTWGIQVEDARANYGRVKARKDAVIKEFADYRVQQLHGGRFEFINTTARFTDPHSLQLGNGRSISAAHFVISTGSKIAPSPLPELDELNCLTSDTALDLERLPKSLIVLGGGAVALEFAQFFARMGTRVTVIQRSAHVLTGADADVAGELEKAFRREGITLYTGTRLTQARRVGDDKEIVFEQEGQTVRVRAEEILFALGRVPQLDSLGLDRIGLKVEGGRIGTNSRMQCSLAHIYAAGDCTGLHEIVHIAIQQGETAVHNILNPGSPRQMDYRLLTEVVFTDPQLAVVGLTEKAAQARGIPYLTASYPFNDHGKSIIMNIREGFVKLLAAPDTGEIIGGCCVGPLGGELIHEIVACMHKRMTVRELATMPHYHPTLAEIWTYPAEELADKIP